VTSGTRRIAIVRTIVRTVVRAVVLATLLAVATRPARAQLKDLSLEELPATGSGTLFAIFLTGDGGWQTLDIGVSKQLAAHGIPVVGFDQRAYLWARKSPDQAGADLARIITAYAAKWHRDSVVVIGYSRGAGIAPFAVNRLPAPQRAMVRSVVLIGAEHGANFQFHMRDIFRSGPAADDVPVMPELRRLGATPMLCFYGADEQDTVCPELARPAVAVKMAGGHHMDGAYDDIGKRILETIGR